MLKGPDFAELKAMLLSSLDSLVRHYFADGHKAGNYWIARNPSRADGSAGSFWIWLRGAKAGGWCDAASGQKGDVINLIGLAIGTDDKKAIRTEALRFLGLPADGGAEPDPAARDKRRAQIAADNAKRAEEDERETAQARWRAFNLWQQAMALTSKTFPGSLAERYLLARGIDMAGDWLAHGRPFPGAVRLLTTHDYHLAGGGKKSGLPCLISLMSGADGKPAAVHRIWLSPDGTGKAALPEPHKNKVRKIWPSHAGTQAVIRLGKGAGGLTPEKAAEAGRRGPLILTEGVEDGLAAMIAAPDYRVWASGSLGNLANAPVLPCVSKIIVCADNDWNKPEAVAQLKSAIGALKRQNVPVAEARSWLGKDVNDLMAGKD